MVLSNNFESTTTAGLYTEDFARKLPRDLLNHAEILSASTSLRFDLAGVNVLTAQLSKHQPDFFDHTKYYSMLLNSSFEAVLIKNFLPPNIPKIVCQTILLAFVRRMGTLSPHKGSEDSLIWTMQPREYENENRFKTFSEHSAEAALHTDSQYRLKPENFLAFYVYRQARCGGGRTRLLNGQRLLESLLASNEGGRVIKTLTSAKIPFLIPPVFLTNSQKNFVKAPIFSKIPFIRYRSDNLQTQNIDASSRANKHEIVESLEFLKKEIEFSIHSREFSLNDGDLLLINNHKNLHGRTAFEDKNRCLFRIRFN